MFESNVRNVFQRTLRNFVCNCTKRCASLFASLLYKIVHFAVVEYVAQYVVGKKHCNCIAKPFEMRKKRPNVQMSK